MPGGYLTFGVYQYLGGERDFGAFWLQLGLPTIVVVAVCHVVLVAQHVVSQRTWMCGSAALVVAMSLMVNLRLLF